MGAYQHQPETEDTRPIPPAGAGPAGAPGGAAPVPMARAPSASGEALFPAFGADTRPAPGDGRPRSSRCCRPVAPGSAPAGSAAG